MDISPELKKRFVQDCCIPIDIFTEPVFTSRIELFDRFYNTMERYNVFLNMIKERYTTYDMESKITVTTHRKGNCSIIAQSVSNPDVKQECKLTILDTEDTSVVKELTLDQTEIYLSVGSSRQLYATILPETLEDKRILWGTSDKSLATVYGGSVTALTKTGPDTPVIITAMSNKDKSKTATCKVYIVDPIEISGIDFVYHQTEIEVGAQERLKVNAVPANATSSSLEWKSSNPSVAEVVDGMITAKSPGWCEITVSSATNPNLKDICYILVHNIVPVSQVILSKSSMDMIVGGFATLGYEVFPEKATNKNVVWSSSNENILTVDPETGLITAVGRGTAIITATSVTDSYKYGQCAIMVNPALFVRTLKIDPSVREIEKEQQFDITATVSVGYGIDPTVQWRSTYEMIATVPTPKEGESWPASTQKSVTVHARDYYNDFGSVKEKIVNYMKSTSGYNSFVGTNMSNWKISCNCLNASIYTPEMDGHTMISIKIDKSKFTPIYHFNPAIFNNLGVWENVVSTIGETDNDHIIYSENLLNDVAECTALSRIQSYGRYILNQFYTDYVKPLISALGVDENKQPFADLVSFTTDEVVIDTSKLTKVVDLDPSEKVLCTNRLIKLFRDIATKSGSYAPSGRPFPLIVRLFTLYKLKTEYEDSDGNTIIDATEISGYVKNIYFEGNQPIEFVGNDICQLPMLMRAMSYQAVQDDDRKFLHEGLVAQFTDDHKIHVPPITSIPDTPKASEESSEEET